MMRSAKITCLVLFGASGACSLAQECDWVLREPELANVAGRALAYDSARGVSVLYAQVIGTGKEQTWEWNGEEWTYRTDKCPDSKKSMLMVYDSKRELSTMYTSDGDTWEWDGQAWSVRADVGDAGMQDNFSMAFDSGRGVTVLFGGFNEESIPLDDTWEFDGVKWKRVAFSGPGASGFNAMAYDPIRKVTVLYGAAPHGDETWEWDGTEWTLRDTDGAPGRRATAGMVFDPALKSCVLFGGDQFANDTWTWDGQEWAQLDLPVSPSVRAHPAMDYDSARSAIVLFGGQTFGNQYLNDTWELTCPTPCYPDLDGNGTLDLFDFLSFVNSFNAGDAGPADCDHNQSLDLFDFLCYTNAFNKGC